MGDQNQRPRQALIPVEQDIVPFYGHDLIAVRLEDGRIAAVLRWLCDSLRLDPQGQLQRIQRKTALAEGLVSVRVTTSGGPQEMPALTLDVLPGYLFTIDENRVKAAARADVVLFQRDCVRVLADHFTRKHQALIPTSADATAVAVIIEQITDLTGVISLLREHLDAQLAATSEQIGALSLRLDDAVTLLEALGERQAVTDSQLARIDERTQRLTPAHARAIQEQVDRMAHETKRLAQPLTYAIIYGRLKHRFRAGSYREIADEQYDAVMGYLQDELRRALAGEAPGQASLF